MFVYELSSAEWRRLRRHPALPTPKGEVQDYLNTYYDTPTGHLRAQGLLLLRVRRGWEWYLEVYREGALVSSHPAGPTGFDFASVQVRDLRQTLTESVAELQPRCSEIVRSEYVLADTAAGQAGLLLEKVSLSVGGVSHGLLRISIRPLGTSAESAYLLARSLLTKYALVPCWRSVPELAERLAAGAGLRAAKARPSLPAGPDGADGGRVFRHIALNCLEHLQQNLPGLLATSDPEFVHQARVSIRRLRSALKLFAPWLPEAFVSEFSERWRIQANALGDCRNLDVFLAETLPLMERELTGEILPARLRQLATQRLKGARRAAREAVASSAARLLVLDFEWALGRLEFPADMGPLRKLARQRLVKRARQVTRLGEAVRSLDPEARHELRIAFKKLRYALEFFSGLFGARRSSRYLAGLVDLQEVLGHLNDLATADTLVQALLPVSASRIPQAWLAGRIGALVDALPVAVGHFLAAEPPWE